MGSRIELYCLAEFAKILGLYSFGLCFSLRRLQVPLRCPLSCPVVAGGVVLQCCDVRRRGVVRCIVLCYVCIVVFVSLLDAPGVIQVPGVGCLRIRMMGNMPIFYLWRGKHATG